jgi:predicted dehydrogenase
MNKYRWGIIGAGWIASQFAEDLKLLPQAELRAIASRSAERANNFAKKFDIPDAYGSWEEMYTDDNIDIVYIATYHTFHFENTLACLKNGKSVICEKPFTMNQRELIQLVDTARENQVFLMEAIWTRFLPSTQKVMEIIKSRELGNLRNVYADFGFRLDYDPQHRLYDPVKGGGALLDIGIYPVFISLLVAGKPENMQATARFTESGVDHSCNMIFRQANDIISSLNCTLESESPVEANLLFEKGRILMESWWLTPGPIKIFRGEQDPEQINFPESGHGYHYEAAEVMRCLDEGLSESPSLPLSFSLEISETLDQIRSICKITYVQDNL